MASFIFDSCCGCIELKTGSLIIGYLNLIGDLILIIFSILGITAGEEIADKSLDKDLAEAGHIFMVISIVLLVLSLFFFVFTVVLLVGIHQSKRSHVKAYLVVTTICLAIAMATTLGSLAGNYTAWEVTCRVLSYILSVYFVMVIRSYYHKMDDKTPSYNA